MGRTKTCPVCGYTMYEETKKVHDDRISTGGDYFVGTGKFYCPHCAEVAEQRAKEKAQKRYEEKCLKALCRIQCGAKRNKKCEDCKCFDTKINP